MEMKYVQDERLNEKVAEVIKDLKKGIISNFHPKSIILTGSFGRGEVTVSEKNRKLKFLSDCEIIIIPYWHIFNRRKINAFESNFYERTGLKIEIWGATLSFYLLLPFLNKKLKPTMSNYDLKYGAKVAYGKNYLEMIPNFKPEDIPLWEGIRLMFNRMAEALEHFSLENPDEGMVFWTDKILLACQDALLLSLGKYHYSYRKRNEMFQSLFPENFEELKEELPNFSDLTVKAMERKLNGTMNVDDSIKYWFDTTEICDKIFRYVIKIDTGIEFKDYLEFQEKYLKHPKIRTYSCGFFSLPICQNLRSVAKMLIIFHKFPSSKHISKISVPWAHVIYSLIPLVYFSLSRSKEINELQLKQARTVLLLFKKLKPPDGNPFEELSYIKEQTVNLWNSTCY